MSKATDCETIRRVSDEHDELMHYTSAAGLAGILSSQSLWASHTSFMNDEQELKLFFDKRLPQIIHEEYSQVGKSVIPEDIEYVASTLAKIIGQSTLKINQTYLFSLCAPHSHSIRKNGLLSQWRGYGTDGGYAIIFDGRRIEELLKKEFDTYDYQYGAFSDVYYFDASHPNPIPPEIKQAEETLRQRISKFIAAPSQSVMEPSYNATTILSCLYKHSGFSEEREVRIIAIPTHSSVRADGGPGQKPKKTPKAFVRDGTLVPYVELLSSQECCPEHERLPMKRIIVGPHRDKMRRKEAVEIMLRELDISVEVEISEIPYIGR